MSLVELLMAVVLLLIGMLGFTESLISSVTTGASTREAGLATQAGRRTIETLQSTPFAQVLATYNDHPGDDPVLPGTAPGADFAVPGLMPQENDADGMVGEIIFPSDGGVPGELRENVADLALGTPRDLNGDGGFDGADHSSDYRVLPVLVRLRWRGKVGDSSAEFRTLLTDL